jgi:hypothetical protein
MDIRQAITTIDVHLSDKSDHLRHAWDVVHAVAVEALKPSHNKQSTPSLCSTCSKTCKDTNVFISACCDYSK